MKFTVIADVPEEYESAALTVTSAVTAWDQLVEAERGEGLGRPIESSLHVLRDIQQFNS